MFQVTTLLQTDTEEGTNLNCQPSIPNTDAARPAELLKQAVLLMNYHISYSLTMQKEAIQLIVSILTFGAVPPLVTQQPILSQMPITTLDSPAIYSHWE